MKPNFALNITDTKLELLRRTSHGWMLVGDAAFDSPDLDEAISYLRASALGLSPHGITTKLIIPQSQVLYTEVQAPGSDNATRRKAVEAALEGLTPYAVKDLVFDFRGSGDTVKVAAVARETLAEAEAFAQGHRLNPVSFVTTPSNGQFAGEPWFGQTQAAEKILPAGEKVTRDQDPINIITRDAQAEAAEAAAKSEADKAAASTREKERLAELAAQEAADKAAAEKALIAEKEQAAKKADQEKAEKALADDAALKEAAEAVTAEQVEKTADTEPMAPKPTAADAAETAAKLKVMEAEAKAILEANSEAKRKAAEAEKAQAARELAERQEKPAAPAATATTEADGADGADAKSNHAASALVAFSSRRRETGVAPALGAAKPASPAATPVVAPAVKSAAPMAETAKAPSAAVLTPAAPSGTPPKLAGAGLAKSPAPTAPKPPVIEKIIATRAPAAEVGDKTISPAPAEKPQPVAPPAKGGFAAMVTAASIPGRSGQAKRSRTKTTADIPRPSRSRSKHTSSTDSLGTFGKKLEPKRGKPRFLGVFLVLILLTAMALVAAWSSYFVSRDDTGVSPVVAEATTDQGLDGTDNAELLADMDPEAVADAAVPEIVAPVAVPVAEVAAAPEVVAAPAPPPEAAPEAAPDQVAGLEPATEPATAEVAAPAVPDVQVAQPEVVPPVATQERNAPAADRQDEIFLASTDGPPPVFDPVSLPALTSRSDAPPGNVAPPPPYGTFYEFDADGLIKPTAEGVITPEGVRLVAARPTILPPPRPAAISAPAVEATPAPDATAVTDSAADTDSAAPVPAVTDNTVASAFSPDPAFSAPRPRARPADAAPAQPVDDDASLANADSVTRLTSLRPLIRPQAVIARAEEAQLQAQAASLVPTAAAEQDRASGSVLAVSYSPRPAARPRDFSAAVAAAVASATRNSPTQETDEANEPEVQVSASAAPRIPTHASVAKQATFSNAINLSKTNLIGVYGTANSRYALIRSSSGSFQKVKVGDRVDGGTVAAITSNELRYKKGSKLLTLSMPKG